MKDLLIVIAVIIIVGAILCCMCLGTNAFQKSQKKQACEVFERESNRETKFVEYTYWQRDCLTPQGDVWISAYNLRGI